MAGTLLVLDTSTMRTVVALQPGDGAPLRDGSAPGPERGAAALGTRLMACLGDAGIRPRDLAAVGVGIGPGSFTGLRVGLATAKALAWSLAIPIVGIPSVEALRRAAMMAMRLDIDPAGIAVVQAAGARDHYLALPGETPRLVPPATGLAEAIGDRPVVALETEPERLVGCLGPGGTDPLVAGQLAMGHLGAALLAILEQRLVAGATDDVAALVPAYVALPRGIGAPQSAWSPQIR